MLRFACVPSGKITGTLDRVTDDGFGINLPQETKGAKATDVPAAPKSFRKSLLDMPPGPFSCSDIQAEILLVSVYTLLSANVSQIGYKSSFKILFSAEVFLILLTISGIIMAATIIMLTIINKLFSEDDSLSLEIIDGSGTNV